MKSNNLYKYLPFIFLFSAFIACYYHTFIWLHYKYSMNDSYYSHGYLIPFISAYLVYMMRDKLKSIERSSSSTGLGLIVFALVIHIVAVMSDINFISGFSIFLYIIGCSMYLLGRKITLKLAFPLVFLVFMFPVPSELINSIGLPTKSFATDVGLLIISWFYIPYFREGFMIHLAETTLVVGTPCNGMKSLVSFSAIGVIALYLTKLKTWKNVIVLLSIYPIAVLINGCRIAILVFIADKYGIEKASPDSYLHDMSGLVAFAAGIIFLFVVLKIFQMGRNDR